MTECEFDLCFYNDNDNKKCLLDKIKIDAAGLCGSCVLPDVSEEVKEQLRNEIIELLKDK